MKFVCKKCCDGYINVEPCVLNVPKDPTHTIKETTVGLTTCPFEGCNYMKGKWITNGEIYKAEWKKA
jgi:hypothetical protein